MRILILTDHLTHSKTNSFYFIANCLLDHDNISHVSVCSRSIIENKDFFEGRKMHLEVKEMKEHVSFDNFTEWIDLDTRTITDLSPFDSILLRLPRPIHPNFFRFLGQCFDEKFIINRPSGIEKTGSKAYLLNLREFTAPIELLTTLEEIIAFQSRFPIVLKPLEEYGGKGILRLDNNVVYQGNHEHISFQAFADRYTRNPQTYLGMKFLKNVKNGDKRIVVANGKILAASLRLPAEDSWLCNVAQGGASHLSETTIEEEKIIRYIDPILKEEGIFMYGLDTIEDDDGKRIISEINTLSVGGIAPVAELSGEDLGSEYAELFISFLQSIK